MVIAGHPSRSNRGRIHVYDAMLKNSRLVASSVRDMELQQKKLARQSECLKLTHEVLFRVIMHPRDGEEIWQWVMPVSIRENVYFI